MCHRGVTPDTQLAKLCDMSLTTSKAQNSVTQPPNDHSCDWKIQKKYFSAFPTWMDSLLPVVSLLVLIHFTMTSFYVPPMQSFPTMWVLVLAGFFYFCVYKWALGPSFVFSEILKVSFCCVNLVPIWKFLNWKCAQPPRPLDSLKIASLATRPPTQKLSTKQSNVEPTNLM